MDSSKEQGPPKKCFCARCFRTVEPQDRVDIENQSFHKLCCMCCVCRTIPTSLKMFYGHVFCSNCFKSHVLSRFKGDNPRIHSNSWWMQWAPGAKPQEPNSDCNDSKCESHGEPTKRCICSRCLQGVDESCRVEIDGQNFHPQCAKCYFCHTVPTNNLKIYYGQVFCEECFNRHVLSQNKDNPSEFFKNCFEHWQNTPGFAENMREFMSSNKDNTPFIFMMQGQQPFCRCGNNSTGQDWFQNEAKKSATPALSIGEETFGSWDLSFENRTEISENQESCNESAIDHHSAAAEKIEKLTKYLHERNLMIKGEKWEKKWKNYDVENSLVKSKLPPLSHGWVNIQDIKTRKSGMDCPKCLWQCGPIYVNSKYL